MRYLTATHQDALGVWSLCHDGVIERQFGGEKRGMARAVEYVRENIGSLVAAAGDGPGWEGELAFTELETLDGRMLKAGGAQFRVMPVPLFWQTETSWGHEGAVIAGRADAMAEKGNAIVGSGVFDTGDDGMEAARLVANQMLDRVSVDTIPIQLEFQVTETDEQGFPTAGVDVFLQYEIGMVTIVGLSAFADARIRLTTPAVPIPAGPGQDPTGTPVPVPASVTAAAPVLPPRAWFERPDFSGPCCPTTLPTGQVFGHIAVWGECHIGRQNICLMAPTSPTNYAYFLLGELRCDDGSTIAVGTITMDTEHPRDPNLGHADALRHYNDTGLGAADVVVGEDEWGIWYAGAQRPELDDLATRRWMASKPSGDWRRVGGALELIAVLQVNAPGFPNPRVGLVASADGELIEMSLTAAAGPVEVVADPLAEITARLDRFELMIRGLAALSTLEPVGV